METETIDRLFLELSQFTRATTGKELALANQLAEAKAEIAQLREQCDRMASLAIDNAKDTERAMRLQEALREIYEVYAGSEGIPQPMTAAEGYLLSLLMEVVRIAQEALKEKE